MLTQEQEALLQDVFDLAEANQDKLTKWERGFLYGDATTQERGFKSIHVLFEELGSRMSLSGKQWKFIRDIYEKLS